MRIGTLGLGDSIACATAAPGSPAYIQYGCGGNPQTVPPGYVGPAPIASVGQDPGPTGYTYGLSKTGDSLICPPGYPYDAIIKDCKGYAGSSADVAAQQLQAGIDVCQSGGGTWDMVNGVCIPAPAANADQLIPGVPNWALYAVGGLLGFMLLTSVMGGRR